MYLKHINIKRNEFNLEFEIGESDYGNINKNQLDKFLDKKLGEFEIFKEIQNINKDDFFTIIRFQQFKS